MNVEHDYQPACADGKAVQFSSPFPTEQLAVGSTISHLFPSFPPVSHRKSLDDNAGGFLIAGKFYTRIIFPIFQTLLAFSVILVARSIPPFAQQ